MDISKQLTALKTELLGNNDTQLTEEEAEERVMANLNITDLDIPKKFKVQKFFKNSKLSELENIIVLFNTSFWRAIICDDLLTPLYDLSSMR